MDSSTATASKPIGRLESDKVPPNRKTRSTDPDQPRTITPILSEGEHKAESSFEPKIDDATSTYIIGSSAEDRVKEHGRTYHTYHDGTYFLPNDEVELNRLDLQHKMFRITLDDKLHLAPISPKPENVLDIATGTGIWAVEFANAYPNANVLGTDLSQIQPADVPANCKFQIQDVEDDWQFPQKFDYIHGRALASCFNDGARVMSSAFSYLKPGGYLELQDLNTNNFSYSGTAPIGSQSEKFHDNLGLAMSKIGRARWGSNVANYKNWLTDIGFEDVKEVAYRWPCNQYWPETEKEKILGAWMQAQVKAGMLESITTRAFCGILGWSQEELKIFLEGVKEEWRNPEFKLYVEILVVWGRKPLEMKAAEA